MQAVRIESECPQDSGSHLSGFHRADHCFCLQALIGYQHHNVGIVVSEAAVLGLFFGAGRVNYADVRLHNDVRRSRVQRRQPGSVEQGRQRGSIEDLANTVARRVVLQHRDRRLREARARIRKPQQRDIVLRRTDVCPRGVF